MSVLHKIAVIAICILSVLVSAATQAAKTKDHPLINRFPDTSIKHYGHVEYEEMNLILSKPYKQANSSNIIADKTQLVAGKLTYIHYTYPSKNSPLQIFRNYQKAIKKQGMEVLFNCERTCAKFNYSDLNKLINNNMGYYLNYGFDQYIVAKKDNFYLTIVVNDGGIWQFVIEEEMLNDDLISPIELQLSETGKIDLYGFLFDTGKSELKEGSEEELENLGYVLDTHPELKIKIVGHTDSMGAEEKNAKLSLARAQSVSLALQDTYGIAKDRLTSSGKGESQPVASNSSKEGRAKNRRVEIIAVNPEVITGTTPNTTDADASQIQPKKKEDKSVDLLKEAKKKVTNAEDVKDLAKRFKKLF